MLTKSNILPAVILAFACDSALCENRMDLPASKSFIEQCEKEALALHPGSVVNQKQLTSGAGFELRFEISDRQAMDWVVFCDAKTGKILRHYQIKDVTP